MINGNKLQNNKIEITIVPDPELSEDSISTKTNKATLAIKTKNAIKAEAKGNKSTMLYKKFYKQFCKSESIGAS